MNEWFKAGFFAMSLVIKAGSDGSFTTLGEYHIYLNFDLTRIICRYRKNCDYRFAEGGEKILRPGEWAMIIERQQDVTVARRVRRPD